MARFYGEWWVQVVNNPGEWPVDVSLSQANHVLFHPNGMTETRQMMAIDE